MSLSRSRIPDQRWYIHPDQSDRALQLALETNRSPLLTQVLLNRGLETFEDIQEFLDPQQELPSALEDFPDLAVSLELLINAINDKTRIAICGDYDADGMTSTALLLRALRYLGGRVDYAIPSRMSEGYGINTRIVEEFYEEGVGLILTVDNGIAAHQPIERARELGLTIIVTDHHDLPPELPNANAILNPKLIAEESPYRSMAGVGVAYVLALCLAQSFGQTRELQNSLLELFTLGTIADLAPLTGVNRRWVKRGLQLLPKSKMAGIQALIQIAGLSNEKNLKPEAIGFRLGPRINAIGRIGDPQVVIELLVTDDDGVALEQAMKCEIENKRRQQLCEQIEKEAIEYYEDSSFDAKADRVLLLVKRDWHHGVIGIVASRLVERYGVPVFIGTYEDDDHIRGSARSIPEFNVFEALEFCKDLMLKSGGHKAAGGFSFKADRLDEIRDRLRTFAHQSLKTEHLKPLVTIDVEADLAQIDLALHAQLDVLHPCGMENPEPVFWTPNVLVTEQRRIGKGHIKLVLESAGQKVNAIAWRWGEYFPLPSPLDVAYRVKSNEWNNQVSVQLEILGVRFPGQSSQTEFRFSDRVYHCTMLDQKELRIQNAKGDILVIQKGRKIGTLGRIDKTIQEVDVSQAPYYDLVKAAVNALAI
ncbi:single-stranded-DNA-specific exonuclease RecJ [Leptolyngbya boryana NIES-2135]|jgi:single-stranded-DNA-specific exonuclease|uniref:Single-stranded-DNA-specific exonuclease RecJ n=1 Tax=Leptolyngbya boryana NIES-2135 TaxID=1973484 RepID=A0A1Z4JJK9_LEPBY|nr:MULTISPECIES: single-stranded-DNA-specific exonuclease RecJ [Leptolyngbya]BAY56853.1 single-stranded-DNA-specific exonuclease RecJ [Leptolyngbya boryana NIES-2135]MBD2368930.1 single-stranded-DNA-specific exonuclease RecJ [Leptolyngbya sp. FACHB-161]MBD2375863.1 single-stranded-DNA-specific exonuclease RecJ [Leptolyngbya sp. FACHB-238]MBD2399977.1 single-stranded-DNA-specific exonuclease RecJ [Leptolyngbya sp. FACHB-239]MBD2406183.1 single-stranded-DNA-specific exonuclease RecJ [Leptolyngby